jgi:putative tryptophan/tyrosine transport system substrate-binding protein
LVRISQGSAALATFLQGLQEFGWSVDRNVRIEYRWGAADAARSRTFAAELLALAPDVIFANGGSVMGPLLQATRTVPIVFAAVADPVGSGFVASLSRPGGNATGFANFEYGVSGKLLELLKQIAPSVSRAAVLRDAATASGSGQFGAIQAVAPGLGVEVTPVGLHDADEIERGVSDFARGSNGGVIVTAGGAGIRHRDLIIALMARLRLPAVYANRFFVTGGGLISYGTHLLDHFRQAAGYVDRVLKGEKPADLPVQAPTKFELAINLRTAKALGLEVPPTLLARADEVIE